MADFHPPVQPVPVPVPVPVPAGRIFTRRRGTSYHGLVWAPEWRHHQRTWSRIGPACL